MVLALDEIKEIVYANWVRSIWIRPQTPEQLLPKFALLLAKGIMN